MLQVRNGEVEMLGVLFDRYQAPLFNFYAKMTQDRTVSEDLVQEVFLRILRYRQTYRPGTNFRAWMYRILRNTFLTSRTGLKATMTVPLDESENGPGATVTSDQPTQEALLIDRDHQNLLQAAIAELPVQFREVLLLCEVEEMSYQEIADTVGVPIGTVMSRLSRARAALRANVQQKLGRC